MEIKEAYEEELKDENLEKINENLIIEIKENKFLKFFKNIKENIVKKSDAFILKLKKSTKTSKTNSSKIHKNVQDFDFSSLYPNITISNNINGKNCKLHIQHFDKNGEDDTPTFLSKFYSNDGLSFCVEYLNLPTVNELVKGFADKKGIELL